MSEDSVHRASLLSYTCLRGSFHLPVIFHLAHVLMLGINLGPSASIYDHRSLDLNISNATNIIGNSTIVTEESSFSLAALLWPKGVGLEYEDSS